MNEIKILLPAGFRFECRECGKCCHRWNFRVDPVTCKNLKNTLFWGEMKAKFPGHEIISFDEDRGTAFMEKVDGECILFENNLCTIHKELGYDAKPLGCRRFPFFFTETPDGIFTGLSYVCPSIRDKTGAPIEKELPLLQDLASQGHFLHMVGSPVYITENCTTDFEGYKVIEKFILQEMEEKGITDTFIHVLTSLALLVQSRNNKGEDPAGAACSCDSSSPPGQNIKNYISPAEIRRFLHNPHSDSFINDPDFTGYQVQTAATMLALLESRNMDETRTNAEIIMNGGNMESETLGKIIPVKHVGYYMNSPNPHRENTLFTDYICHLLWWKYPLTTGTVMTGLSMLSLLPRMFDWYAFVAEKEAETKTEAEGRKEPDGVGVGIREKAKDGTGAEMETEKTAGGSESAFASMSTSESTSGSESVSVTARKTALGWIDTHIHHGHFLEIYIKRFADDFVQQVEVFMEEGVM